jgi:hypothetical protein
MSTPFPAQESHHSRLFTRGSKKAGLTEAETQRLTTSDEAFPPAFMEPLQARRKRRPFISLVIFFLNGAFGSFCLCRGEKSW